MKQLKAYRINVFGTESLKGNPAGVILDPEELSDKEMSDIARAMDCPETVFIMPSSRDDADLLMRFFTPSGDEVDFCGHASIASFYALADSGKFPPLKNDMRTFFQDTGAGVNRISVSFSESGEIISVTMSQRSPEILAEKSNWDEVASLLGVDAGALGIDDLPMQVVSTGLSDLFIPVRSKMIIEQMNPDFKALSEYQKANGIISFHPFSFDTVLPENDLHVRDFAPSVGIDEEAATGSANAALSAYLVMNSPKYREQEHVSFRIEQGFEMDNPCVIHTKLAMEKGRIVQFELGGTAEIFFKGTICLK